MHALLVLSGVLWVRKFWAAKLGGRSGSAGFREPILADFVKRPTSRTRGQTQHYEAHMCTFGRNKHKQSMGAKCASGGGHVGTCLHILHMRSDTYG